MEKGSLSRGQKVLIYGASGTSGTIAVQYARYLGASVTAVCGPGNAAFVQSLGAERVIDYTRPDLVKDLERYDFIQA